MLPQLAAGGGFFDKLKAAKKPVVIVGPGVLKRPDRDAVLKSVHALVEKAGEWEREGALRRMGPGAAHHGWWCRLRIRHLRIV